MLDDIQIKNIKIQQLEQDIKDLNELFRDLEEITQIQNETIDNTVSPLITQTKHTVQSATLNIEQSKQYHTSSVIRNVMIGSIIGCCIGGPLGGIVGGTKTIIGCTFIGGIAGTF